MNVSHSGTELATDTLLWHGGVVQSSLSVEEGGTVIHTAHIGSQRSAVPCKVICGPNMGEEK
jgi:hypothetical protein